MSLSHGSMSPGLPALERRGGFGRAWQIVSAGTFLLAVLTALVSYRYVLGIPPIPDGIAANAFRTPWLVLHVGSASTALLLGAIQFTAVPRWGRLQAHRMIGRIYVVSCLVGAATGLVLAVGTSAGPVAALGFGSLAVAWALTNVLGWQHALSGRIATHRRWMIRSWALTLAAVTLRVYVAAAAMADLPEDTAYVAISFLCWVPNLIVAEWMLRARMPILAYRTVIGPRSS